MKNYILFVILFVGIACKSTQSKVNFKKSSIVYILPLEVEQLLKSKVKGLKNISFEIRRNEDKYWIFLNDKGNFLTNTTNRKIAINSELYPLFIDLDYIFGSSENETIVLERLKNDSSETPFTRKKNIIIYDNSYRINFKENGKVLYQGYGDNIKKM